jgi:hypothetical protein
MVAQTNSLLPFIEENIEHGSTIITDGWTGYSPLSENKDYKHITKNISSSGKQAHELLPHVHIFIGLAFLSFVIIRNEAIR